MTGSSNFDHALEVTVTTSIGFRRMIGKVLHVSIKIQLVPHKRFVNVLGFQHLM